MVGGAGAEANRFSRRERGGLEWRADFPKTANAVASRGGCVWLRGISPNPQPYGITHIRFAAHFSRPDPLRSAGRFLDDGLAGHVWRFRRARARARCAGADHRLGGVRAGQRDGRDRADARQGSPGGAHHRAGRRKGPAGAGARAGLAFRLLAVVVRGEQGRHRAGAQRLCGPGDGARRARVARRHGVRAGVALGRCDARRDEVSGEQGRLPWTAVDDPRAGQLPAQSAAVPRGDAAVYAGAGRRGGGGEGQRGPDLHGHRQARGQRRGHRAAGLPRHLAPAAHARRVQSPLRCVPGAQGEDDAARVHLPARGPHGLARAGQGQDRPGVRRLVERALEGRVYLPGGPAAVALHRGGKRAVPRRAARQSRPDHEGRAGGRGAGDTGGATGFPGGARGVAQRGGESRRARIHRQPEQGRGGRGEVSGGGIDAVPSGV